jgi:hypothetical protein
MDTNTVIIIFLVAILLIILFKTHVTVINPQPVKPVPVPVPYIKPIGGCAGTRYGCCPNGVTPRMNPAGTNC